MKIKDIRLSRRKALIRRLCSGRTWGLRSEGTLNCQSKDRGWRRYAKALDE